MLRISLRRGRAVGLAAVTAVAAVAATATVAAPARADETVESCGSYPDNVFTFQSSGAYTPTSSCASPGGSLWIRPSGDNTRGESAHWYAVAPTGLTIQGATMQQTQYGVGSNTDYGGGYFWSTGGAGAGVSGAATTASFGSLGSSEFGFQIVCGKTTGPCTAADGIPLFQVGSIALDVSEATPPSLTPSGGLVTHSGWIRGSWPLGATAGSVSGVCSITATVAGTQVAAATASRDVTEWTQCGSPTLSSTVNTAQLPNGSQGLSVSATDAAGRGATANRTLQIDNVAPTVAIAAPAVASNANGIPTATATATAGPSGLRSIACSVDDGPTQTFSSSPAQLPLNGLGVHQVQCTATSNAVDPSGTPASSAPATSLTKVGAVTVSALSFHTIADRLRCHKVSERVTIPAHTTTVRHDGRRIRVRVPTRHQRVRLTRCHARTVRRRITIKVAIRRHGHRRIVRRHRTVRVVVEPHVVQKASLRVRHGHRFEVHGFLATTNGIALGGQAVRVLTAPDDGSNRYRLATTVTTDADGGWSARLPAGPSRLIEARYGGSTTTLGATSAPIDATVPARVALRAVAPRAVAWGGTVTLRGALRGGYLPRGGALVRLRIGYGRAETTYGVHAHITGSGAFRTTYTFGVGPASVHRRYWFEIATLPEGDYPWVPAHSVRRYVDVGGHPRPARRHHRHRRR